MYTFPTNIIFESMVLNSAIHPHTSALGKTKLSAHVFAKGILLPYVFDRSPSEQRENKHRQVGTGNLNIEHVGCSKIRTGYGTASGTENRKISQRLLAHLQTGNRGFCKMWF